MKSLARSTEFDLPFLFELTSLVEPWWNVTEEICNASFRSRNDVFLLLNDGKPFGQVSYSNYVPKLDVTLHCSVLPEYQKRWWTRHIGKQIFDFAFDTLECVRVSGWSIRDITDGDFLIRLGFKLEGTFRDAVRLSDGTLGVIQRYGMLSSERRW